MPGLKILVIIQRFNKGSTYIYDPNDIGVNYGYYIPIGLAYITSALKFAGYDVNVLNLNHKEGSIKDEIRLEMCRVDYDIVFMGGLSMYYPNILDMIKYIRETSNAKIVVGGGLISTQPELMFNLLHPDYVIIGEGEVTAVELVKAIENDIDLQIVDGIGYMYKGHGVYEDRTAFVLTKPRDLISNLDVLPFPDYDALGFDEFLDNTRSSYIYDAFDYPRAYPILASRSCPFKCTFCFHTLGNKYRQRSIDSIMKEVEYATKKYRINIFFFYDELFAYDKERALEFCKRFKEFSNTVPWQMRFTLDLRVDCVDEDILDALKDAGCNPIGLGLESYSLPVLKSMKKHITPEQIKTVLRMMVDRDIAPKGNFIFGDTVETLKTAQETLDLFKTDPDLVRGLRVTFIIPFQGCEIYKQYINGIINKDEIKFIEERAKIGYDFHEPINLTKLSDGEFEILKDKVFTLHYTGYNYVVPDKVEDNKIEVTCPYCGNHNVYVNMIAPNNIGISNVGCRKCNGRFELVSKYYFIPKFLIKTFGFMRLYKVKKIINRFIGGII